MNVLAGWGATNRLVRRVRRHGAFATLFRASMSAESGMPPALPRLTMGQVGHASAWGEHTLATPETMTAPLPVSAEPWSPAIAAHVVARDTVEAPHTPVILAPPGRGQSVPPSQTTPMQPGRAIHAASAPAASPHMADAAPSPANAPSEQAAFAREASDVDQTWRRLQRIRQLHTQKLAMTEATSSEAAEVQRTPAQPQSSTPLPVVSGTQPAGDSLVAPAPRRASAAQTAVAANDSIQRMPAQSYSAPSATRSHDPGAAMRSGATANQAVRNQPLAAPSASSSDAQVIDSPAGQASATNVQTDQPPDAARGGAARSHIGNDISAPVVQQRPVEAAAITAEAPVVGATELRQFDPAAPHRNIPQPPVQRAPLEAAWPVIEHDGAVPVIHPVASAQEVGAVSAPSGAASSDRYAADVVRRRVAKIDTQVATDSKVDVITPRRPPPFVRKAPAAHQPDVAQPASVQSESVQPEPVQPKLAESAAAANLTQRLMVETEIGALPADLWRLIGEEAPVGNERTQPVASRQDARMAQAVAPVDAAVVQQTSHAQTPASEANHPTLHTGERIAGAGANLAVDDLATIGRSDVTQLAAATSAVVSSERQDESPPHHPISNLQSLTPEALPGLSQGALTSEASNMTGESVAPSFVAGPPSMINGAAHRSSLADEIFAVRGESIPKRDSLTAVALPAADKNEHAALLHFGAPFQTVQLAPIETALHGVSRADADVAALGMSEVAGQQGQIDVDDLARQVYRQLRRKLALEWERVRPDRY